MTVLHKHKAQYLFKKVKQLFTHKYNCKYKKVQELLILNVLIAFIYRNKVLTLSLCGGTLLLITTCLTLRYIVSLRKKYTFK